MKVKTNTEKMLLWMSISLMIALATVLVFCASREFTYKTFRANVREVIFTADNRTQQIEALQWIMESYDISR